MKRKLWPAFILIIGTSVLLLSCKEKIQEQHRNSVITFNSIKVSKDPYTIEKMIPLETKEDNILKEFLLLRANYKGFFILDKEKNDAIHHFDMEGNYLGRILEVGKGPEMLPNINDFIATDQGLEILIGKGDQSEIWVFDHELSLAQKIALDYLAFTFSKLPNGNYALCGGYNKPIVMHRLVISDPEGNIVEELLPNEYSNDLLPVGEHNFNTANSGLFYHEFYNPTLYELKGDGLTPRYELDMGKNRIPDEYWDLDWMQGFELISKNGFAFPSHFFETEERAFFGVNVQANMQLANHQLVLDKKTGDMKRRITSNENNPVFFQLAGLFDEQLIFIAQAKDVMTYEPKAMEKQGLSIEAQDNPVLVFAKF